ncbi:hypothetical protein CDAR_569091 [Caerostris darwini]|uniref:Uncharacterized protein n=1 Tax=Caerostris darwini TaxID=1538125 RepID=A0AAV4QDE8_9ARAC|nr:hypothetical protein CDAR_569091 [Caerostris darwini]
MSYTLFLPPYTSPINIQKNVKSEEHPPFFFPKDFKSHSNAPLHPSGPTNHSSDPLPKSPDPRVCLSFWARIPRGEEKRQTISGGRSITGLLVRPLRPCPSAFIGPISRSPK